MLTLRDAMAGAARALSRDWYRAWPPARRTLAVVGLAGFEPATSATQNCYEPRTRMLALH